jgi:hypothetical protein
MEYRDVLLNFTILLDIFFIANSKVPCKITVLQKFTKISLKVQGGVYSRLKVHIHGIFREYSLLVGAFSDPSLKLSFATVHALSQNP